MTGSDYRARVRLSTKDNATLAEVGESCTRVPASSLPLLLASRKIEAIPIVEVATEAVWTDLGRRDA
jgi:hypothetical protein